MKAAQFFIPKTDAGILLLRLATWISLFVLFGLAKAKDAIAFPHTGHWGFVDFNRRLGLPVPVVVAYVQAFNESVCALLVACGLFTQIAAGLLAVGFAAATACSLKVGEASWFLAAYYSVIFATIALTGAGKYSLDALKNR
jgi:uncharacterized membrane protein YphA (DoxX/SURF4 family)